MTTGKRHSKKREAILDCIANTEVHPSAEWIYARLKPEIPDLSIATVYRNLNLFKEEGAVMSVATVNGLERFDANTAPHVHFICECCDSIIDMPLMEVPEELMETAANQLKASVTGCSLTFTGICNKCRK